MNISLFGYFQLEFGTNKTGKNNLFGHSQAMLDRPRKQDHVVEPNEMICLLHTNNNPTITSIL